MFAYASSQHKPKMACPQSQQFMQPQNSEHSDFFTSIVGNKADRIEMQKRKMAGYLLWLLNGTHWGLQ